MFLRHHPHYLQPISIKSFYYFCSIYVEKWSLHHKFSVSVGCHLPPFCLFVFGWLFYNQLVAAHTKGWKFPEITLTHHFYSILFIKIKNKKLPPPASFPKKVSEKHIINIFLALLHSFRCYP